VILCQETDGQSPKSPSSDAVIGKAASYVTPGSSAKDNVLKIKAMIEVKAKAVSLTLLSPLNINSIARLKSQDNRTKPKTLKSRFIKSV
jgi:hypothetical protein